MSLDVIRIKKYLQEITRGGGELKALVRENQLKPGSVSLKAAKYLLIELAEGGLWTTAVLSKIFSGARTIFPYSYLKSKII